MSRPATILTTAALLAGLAAAGAAHAQSDPASGDGPRYGRHGDGPHGGAMGGGSMLVDFAAIDADADGTLSRDELRGHVVTRLTVFDLNGDGMLDAGELAAVMPAPPHAAFFRPFAPDRAARFAGMVLERMDATEAGSVAIADMGERQVNAVLARVDTDHDGAISQEEAEARPRHHARGPRGDDHRPRNPRF